MLDIFRDAADYWSDRKIAFPAFILLGGTCLQGEPAATEDEATAEAMPTDKLVDVSPMALRMSSPFNAGYWMAAA